MRRSRKGLGTCINSIHTRPVKRRLVDILFTIGLIGKGIDSLLEVIGGIMLLSPVRIDYISEWLTQHELHIIFRHPHIAHLEESTVLMLGKASIVGAIYLIIHGAAKVVLIVAIAMKKRWGYDGLILVLAFFATIEIVHGILHSSWLAAVFSLGDFILAWLIWRELKRLPERTTP